MGHALSNAGAKPLSEWALQLGLGIDELLGIAPALKDICHVLPEVLEDLRYAPYVARQEGEIARLRRDATISLDAIGSYSAIGGLSNEMIERLDAARPGNLAEAGRVRGITPAALSAILVAAQRRVA